MKKRNKKIIAALSAIFGLLVIGALCWSFVLCYRTLHPPRLTDLSWLTRQYPHTTEWLDSIRSNGLLHDIVRLNADGERLHARWLWAPEPTEKTAVLFHGYQGSAETMLMIGYLFNHDFGFNVLIPDLRGPVRRFDGCRHYDDRRCRRVAARMCPLCRGGLWLHFNPGYLCRFLGEAVPTAALSALPSIGPLVPDPLRMEFRKGFSARCRAPMQVAYVVHSRRQGLGRPCGNGSPAVRSENRRQGTLDTFRRRSWCRLSPRSADICAARPHIRGALVRMPRHP